MTIYAELSRIQKELKAPKGQFNKFGGYSYRSCEDILEAVKPLLKDCILTVSDEVIQIGDRYYIKAVARLSLSADEFIENSALAREPDAKKGMDEAQVTGSTSSYARKYALNGLFAIDDNKDADATNDHGKAEPAKSAPQPASKPKPTLTQSYEACLVELKKLSPDDYAAKDQKFKDRVNEIVRQLNDKGANGYRDNLMAELTRLTSLDFLNGEPKQDYRI